MQLGQFYFKSSQQTRLQVKREVRAVEVGAS